MEHILVTIVLLGLYYFYRYYYRDDGKDYSSDMNTDQEDYQKKLMLDIFFRTARTLHVEVEKCRVQECK